MLPVKTTSSELLLPKTALPVTVSAYAPVKVPLVVTVDPSKVLSAALNTKLPT